MGEVQVNSLAQDIWMVAQQAVAGMQSAETRRVYSIRLRQYLLFADGQLPSRSQIQAWMLHLRENNMGAAGMNQSLSAVKKLVEELGERSLLDRTTVASVQSLHREKQEGVRVGNWLDLDQARAYINLPTKPRDRALLATMVGCGLRREELASLTWDKFQLRWGRWCLVDIVGKGGRVRTVAVPDWAAERLNEYRSVGVGTGRTRGVARHDVRAIPQVGRGCLATREGVSQGHPLPPLTDPNLRPFGDQSSTVEVLPEMPGSEDAKEGFGEVDADVTNSLNPYLLDRKYGLPNDHLSSKIFRLSASGIWFLVGKYAKMLNLSLAPHDLRRTFAALSEDGGAEIRQIQAELGHASLETTERYLGQLRTLKPGKSAGDHIKL